MQDFKPEHLKSLLEDTGTDRDSIRVSAYVPTVRAGDTQQNRIRFKNLVLGARDALETSEVAGDGANGIVDLLDERLRAEADTERQHEGLAVFASAQTCTLLRCPREFDPLLTVGDRYHVLPLLPLADEARRYWVLALSRDCTRLIRAYCDSGSEYDLTDTKVPRRLTDVVGKDVEKQSLQFQSTRGGSQNVFHGQGRGDDDVLREVEQYCRAVGAAVANETGDAPVVLAGEERMTSMFENIVEDLNIRSRTIGGNHDDTRADELAAMAWPIIAADVDDEETALLARYERDADAGRVSNDADVIEVAAGEGRIDTLLLDGRILSEAPQRRPTDAMRHSGRPPGGVERRANRITTTTLRYGGSARFVETKSIPNDAPFAALMRY